MLDTAHQFPCCCLLQISQEKNPKQQNMKKPPLRKNLKQSEEETMWMIMESFLYVRGSKGVEAGADAEEEPARKMEVVKGVKSESKQLVFNRMGEER